MTDPVADKSGFLKMYMSNHPDTLVAYAKWYGKVVESVTSAEMTAIDSKTMTLDCTLKDGIRKQVVIALDPPLSGYDDVKPRLLEMKARSQEGLGMIKSPVLTTFRFPSTVLTQSFPPVLALLYCTFAPNDGAFAPARFIQPYIQGKPLKYAWAVFVVLHLFEGLYTLSLARKHATLTTGAAYVLNALAFGFPIWIDMRKRIQAARIESVMKIE
ncbi:hypothetical protein B0H17DRAFT_937715 [Mycena rosella]|uniref:DUF2470 domain-containing protein n=1 Tax=Mycena rosella TaxID=1033263 RepID=A0AAD7DDD5_MYCRO|nr:hypothetical protein B0H17DRAFT_937715 [Mycena rosella]